jgi:hypothetical protein
MVQAKLDCITAILNAILKCKCHDSCGTQQMSLDQYQVLYNSLHLDGQQVPKPLLIIMNKTILSTVGSPTGTKVLSKIQMLLLLGVTEQRNNAHGVDLEAFL